MTWLVDVGGYRLAVEQVGNGRPPVVCVSGLTGAFSEWQDVLPDLAALTSVVTYARPGMAGSDPLPAELADRAWPPSRAAEQLHTLLTQAGVPAPRVLATHSLGGLIAEAYAARYPDHLAGLVLLDPTAPAMFLERAARDPIREDDPAGIRFDLAAADAERRDVHLPDVPAVVVSQAPHHPWWRADPQMHLPWTPEQASARWQAFQREWVARLAAVHVIAVDAGHLVHEEAPGLAALAVSAVIDAVRAGTGGVRLDRRHVTRAGGRLA